MHSDELEQERKWIEAAKRNRRHFSPLYEKYHEGVFRYIHQRCGDIVLAQDLASDTFVKAMENLPTYEFRGKPLLAWLYTIARNEVNGHFRKNAGEARPVLVESSSLTALIQGAMGEEEEPSSDHIPLLLDCLQTLPHDKLELIEWFHFEGRPYREIADMLNLIGANEAAHPGEWKAVSENTLKVRAKRVRDQLKNCIQKKIKAGWHQ